MKFIENFFLCLLYIMSAPRKYTKGMQVPAGEVVEFSTAPAEKRKRKIKRKRSFKNTSGQGITKIPSPPRQSFQQILQRKIIQRSRSELLHHEICAKQSHMMRDNTAKSQPRKI